MKKLNKLIALFMLVLSIFPFFLTGCIRPSYSNPRGDSSSGGSSGDSGSSGGSDSGSAETPVEDDYGYIEFEDAVSGIKTSYVSKEGISNDSQYNEYVFNAINNTQQLALDILIRLAGEYCEEIKVNDYYDTNEISYNDGKNVENLINDTKLHYNIADSVYLKDYYSSSADYKNGNDFVVSPDFTQKPDGTITFDAVKYVTTFVQNNLVDTINTAIEKDGQLTRDRKITLSPFEQFELSYDVQNNLFIFKITTNTVKEEAFQSSNPYSHKQVAKNWVLADDINFEGSSSVIANLKRVVTYGILSILSGKDVLVSDIKTLKTLKTELNEKGKIDYYNELAILVKDIDHYGINAKDKDGNASTEVKKIVNFVLNCVIGTDNIKTDQAKIYKKNDNGKSFIQQNQGTYDYNSTVRYNDANINNLNTMQTIINPKYFSHIVTGTSGTTGYENKESFDQIYANLFGNSNAINFVTSNDLTNIVNNGYEQTKQTQLNYLVEPGFCNYINMVEFIVSSACNATYANTNTNPSQEGVYRPIKNVYEYEKAGLYESNIKANLVAPSSFDIDDENEQENEELNYLFTGEKEYQSLVMFFKDTTYTDSNNNVHNYNKSQFNYMYLQFLSTLGNNGSNFKMDLYLRYHTKDKGFSIFKNGVGTGKTLYKLNSEDFEIEKGSVEELSKNNKELSEIEIDLQTALKNRLTESGNPCNNFIVLPQPNLSAEDYFTNTQNNKANLTTGNNCYSAQKITLPTGEEKIIMSYDNLNEEYLEILFVAPENCKFNYAFYLTEFLTPEKVS